jgi:hypothetical protein
MARVGSSPLFSWLHLSDIHFGHGGATEREHRRLVLDQFLLDLRRAEQWGAPAPDAVFVTGDIGFSGDALGRNEYVQAEEWLRRLADVLGLEPRDLHLVPGNHDAARVKPASAAAFSLLEELRAGTRKVDDVLDDAAACRLLMARQHHYQRLSERFGPPSVESSRWDDLSWNRRLKAQGVLPVRIVGLNTALLANDDTDERRLRLGLRQLNQAFTSPDPDELVIVLGHHPPGWLGDGMEAGRWLESRADILLTGHVHSQDSLLTQRGGGRRFVHVAAGALHEAPDTTQGPGRFAFNFGSVHAARGGRLELQVWPFVWTKHYEFRPDQEHIREPGRHFTVHELERPAPASVPRREPDWRPPKAGSAPPTVTPPRVLAKGDLLKLSPTAALKRYQPPLAVYVVWHPDFKEGERYALSIYSALVRDAGQPLSRGLGIPVFFRSEPDVGSAVPPPISFDEAVHTAVVVLVDGHLVRHAHEGWGRYVAELWRATHRGTGTHRVYPVSLSPHAFQVDPELAEDNFIRLHDPAAGPEEQRQALLVSRLTNELCRLLLQRPRISEAEKPEEAVPPVKLFLSHTKVRTDPGVQISRELRTYIHERWPLQTFFDALDIPAGNAFGDIIQQQLRAGTGPRQPRALVAIQTDAYASREWCQREILLAKRRGIPIIVVHAVERGEERSFPYLGNVPTYRWNTAAPPEERCRAVLDLSLSEVLRHEFLTQQLRALLQQFVPPSDNNPFTPEPLSRSPELLTFLSKAGMYIYPDPPLGEAELEILREQHPDVELVTPLQLTARLFASRGRP